MYNDAYNSLLAGDPYYYPTAYFELHSQAEDSAEQVYSQELEPVIPYPDDVFGEVDDTLEEAEDVALGDLDNTVFDDPEDTIEFTVQEGMGCSAPPLMLDRSSRPQLPRPQLPRPGPPRPQPPWPEPSGPQPPQLEPPRPQPPKPQPLRPQPPRSKPSRPQSPRPQPPRPQPLRPGPPQFQPPRPQPPRSQPPRLEPLRPQPPRPQPPRSQSPRLQSFRPQSPRPQSPRLQPPRFQSPRPDWSWGRDVFLPGNVFLIIIVCVRFYNITVREPAQIYVNDRLTISSLDFLSSARLCDVASGCYRVTAY